MIIRDLIKSLNEASDAYYNTGNPIMSDSEWDSLFDQLKYLEKETGIVYPDSPTQTVGYEVKSELKKVVHTIPMLSLDKTKSVADLNSFKGKHDAILSLKLDGLTCRLTYKDGKLWRGETRGNGEIGEDITHNVQHIVNIPQSIPYKDTYEIDGEIIITYDDFAKINANLPEDSKYKNPRNLASGSVRQLDSKVSAERKLKFVAWKPVSESGSYEYQLRKADRLGFTIVPYVSFSENEDVRDDDIEILKEAAEVASYPIDGLVIAYDDITYGNSLGRTGHHFKSGLAFKFGEEEAESILRDIEWSMGRTGELTPVAVFDPVELAGTEVSRASLHNISIMEKLYPGLWMTELELTVVKANEIIPQIVSVNEPDRDVVVGNALLIPDRCPICGSPTEVKTENKSSVLICTNYHCSGKKLGQFVQYCSKDAMDIKGLSEATLKMMLDKGIISEYKDLYFLNLSKTRLSQLPGMGSRSVNNLIKAIEKSRHTTLDRFLVALSIPNIGRSAAKAIRKHMESVSDFMEKWESGYAWSKMDDFGDITERSLNDFYRENSDMIEDLLGILEFDETETIKGNLLDGLTFVITGAVNHFTNRNELKAKIEQLGGKVAGSVSKKTSYLINNDTESSSSKNKKAKSLGIPIISEDEFLAITNKRN